MNRILKYGAVGAIALAGFAAAPAQAVNYEGKTITFVIGYGFGGTYGKYSRLMSKHLKRFIPGNPNIVVQSMPGAGGIKMTNYAAHVMPKTGLYFLVPPDASVVSQLLRPKKVKYDARKFTWIGSTNQTNTIMVVRRDTGISKWQDMRKIELISGNTGPGSTSFLIPRMMKVMLGLKIKQISGYKGSSKTVLAMEQGEHFGTGFNWLAWNSKVPHWFTGPKDKTYAVAVMQTGVWQDPDLKGVPMLRDVVDDKYKGITSFMATLGILGRGLALPPGASKTDLSMLRGAFSKMAHDAEYVAEAKRRKLRVIYTSGKEIQDFVTKAFAEADPKVVAQARKMIFGK